MLIGFVKAMLNHCKLESETLTQFRQEFARLTDADKAWFREQFTREFGYKIVG